MWKVPTPRSARLDGYLDSLELLPLLLVFSFSLLGYIHRVN